MNNAQFWINKLQLQPHPEGGYFREIYRNNFKVVRTDTQEIKNAATSIYFLLGEQDKSHFHRLKSDEIWYFHQGNPLKVCMFSVEGKYTETILGCNIEKGEQLQIILPIGTIFGAYPLYGGFCLMGCMVNPGFDFSDFELFKRDELLSMFPENHEIIKNLTSD